MTTEQHTKYLEDPNNCPYCGSDDYDRVDTDGDTYNVWYTWSCSNKNCGKSWTEEYTLTAVFLDDDYED